MEQGSRDEPVDPFDLWLEKVMRKLMSITDMNEAEKYLASELRKIRDEREVLLERRARFCSDVTNVLKLIQVAQRLEELTPEDEEYYGLMAQELAGLGLLLQCTPRWARAEPEEKARVLAPLYKALYLLRSNDPSDVESAIELSEEALRRAEDMGLDKELTDFIRLKLDNALRPSFN